MRFVDLFRRRTHRGVTQQAEAHLAARGGMTVQALIVSHPVGPARVQGVGVMRGSGLMRAFGFVRARASVRLGAVGRMSANASVVPKSKPKDPWTIDFNDRFGPS